MNPINLNLDACSETELQQYAVGLASLTKYAEKKGEAQTLRKEGKIAKAQRLEDAADGIFRRLPEWARW